MFVSMAYMLNSAYIYLDAKIELGFPLRKIESEYFKPEDLIFFPGHVVKYIGNGEYIHSSLGGNEVNLNSVKITVMTWRQQLRSTAVVIKYKGSTRQYSAGLTLWLYENWFCSTKSF